MKENDVVPIDRIPTRDELVKILKTTHRAIILEADEWRPIAQYVHDLIRAVLRGHGVNV
jgi:hypothetical protein